MIIYKYTRSLRKGDRSLALKHTTKTTAYAYGGAQDQRQECVQQRRQPLARAFSPRELVEAHAVQAAEARVGRVARWQTDRRRRRIQVPARTYERAAAYVAPSADVVPASERQQDPLRPDLGTTASLFPLRLAAAQAYRDKKAEQA